MTLLESGATSADHKPKRPESNQAHDISIDAEAASQFLKGMANPGRLMILCLLARSGRDLSVSELEDRLDIRQPTLSQQLARLREDGLVDTRRKGKSIFYRISNRRASILALLLSDWFDTTELEA